MSEKQVYHYCCKGDSPLGAKLIRLIDRYGEVMQAAADLCGKIGSEVEFVTNERFAAGGIRYFILKGKLRAKKLLSEIETINGETYCIPNPNTNRGMKLARKVAELPHVTYDELCEPFDIDCHDPANKHLTVPRFFDTDRQWVYIKSDTALPYSELAECGEDAWEKAKKYAEENEN